MIDNSYLASPVPESEAAPPLVLGSPVRLPGRRPLRHLLVGHPDDIEQVIKQLHVLNYAEQFRWSSEILVPPEGITLTPQQGDALRYLIRWQRLPRP